MVAALTVLEVLGIFLVVPIIIGLIIISLAIIFEQLKQKITGNVKESIENLVCSIDNDCPAGYVCIDGKCFPQAS